MSQKLLTIALPLALPFLVYAFYLFMLRRRARADGRDVPQWQDGPWGYFALAGVLLVGISLGYWRFAVDGELGGYITPQKLFKDEPAAGSPPAQ